MLSPTDPFRFDDRTGHYGTGQADLAPVSPLAAAPRQADNDRPLDPMGGSPSEEFADAVVERSAPQSRIEAQADAQSNAELTSTSEPGAVQAQTASSSDANVSVSTEMRETPMRDESTLSQTVLMRTQTEARIEGEARGHDTPVVSSGGTPVSLLLDARPEPAESAGSFADMAARMDQIMAEMAARMEALCPWPGSDDSAEDETDAAPNSDRKDVPDALAEAQGRLDELFGSLSERLGGDAAVDGSGDPFDAARDRLDDPIDSLSDRFGGDGAANGDGDAFDAARDRLDDLAGVLDLMLPDDGSDRSEADPAPDPLTQAAARLDDLKADLGYPDAEEGTSASPGPDGSLLARLFDGDAAPADEMLPDRTAELFDGLDDLFTGSQTLGFDPGRWDDLPDFG